MNDYPGDLCDSVKQGIEGGGEFFGFEFGGGFFVEHGFHHGPEEEFLAGFLGVGDLKVWVQGVGYAKPGVVEGVC